MLAGRVRVAAARGRRIITDSPGDPVRLGPGLVQKQRARPRCRPRHAARAAKAACRLAVVSNSSQLTCPSGPRSVLGQLTDQDLYRISSTWADELSSCAATSPAAAAPAGAKRRWSTSAPKRLLAPIRPRRQVIDTSSRRPRPRATCATRSPATRTARCASPSCQNRLRAASAGRRPGRRRALPQELLGVELRHLTGRTSPSPTTCWTAGARVRRGART